MPSKKIEVLSQTITPFLWFNNKAEEAAKFYTSIFKNSKITSSSPMSTEFTLDGLQFIAFNGGPTFKFNPAISLFVSCESQKKVDYYWNRLSVGGKAVRCGWLKDKYGISWQVVPSILGDLLGDSDREKANRTMNAMMKMKKLEIGKLKKAHSGR